MNNELVEQHPQIPLLPVAQRDIDGIQMGVLGDGTAYLTMRGLSRMCGTPPSVLSRLVSGWAEDRFKPRGRKISDALQAQQHPGTKIGFRTMHNGVEVIALSDVECMAILEYYAFDAGKESSAEALLNYRLLARSSFRAFIYAQVGYDPSASVPSEWRQFHDRVSLTYNSVPAGYFGVFKEMADMVVTLGQAGIHIDANFVPDISVGMAWGKHWTKSNFDSSFAPRAKFEHNYPEYFPQAVSNPQEPWCYPESALGEFRRWLREEYIGGGKFSRYIESKVAEKRLPPSFAQLALSAYTASNE